MLSNDFKNVIKNLEDNIENEKDLEYAKSQIAELSLKLWDEFEDLKMSFQQRIKVCEQKIDIMEKSMQKINEEIFEEDIDTELEPIKCPYCEAHFYIQFNDTKKEIICPNCNNEIELDWGNFEDDM